MDDLIVARNVEIEIDQFKCIVKSEFKMTYLGFLNYFLDQECVHTNDGILLHQKQYICEILKRFNMENCNFVAAPIIVGLKLTKELDRKLVDVTLFKQIVGSLRFLFNNRPDISFGVGLISKFIHNPKAPHMASAKHILRYPKGKLIMVYYSLKVLMIVQLFWWASLIQTSV